MKISFYIQNRTYPNVDLREPEKGNPGIGGTQYTALATAYYLKLYYPEVEVLLLVNIPKNLPDSLEFIQVENAAEAAEISEKEKCDIFVFRSRKGDDEVYDKLNNLNIKAVARSNNTPDRKGLKKIASSSRIKRHVCVSQEQLDMLRDHKVFGKSSRIFDLLNADNYAPKHPINKDENTVVFLGNIIPSKGFHVLARVWSKILDRVPDAKLIVIGSAKLYDRDMVLGKWGIAEKSYENKFIKYILTNNHKSIMSSVHFAGLVNAEEKIKLLQNAAVGVVNPSAKTENCPGSALEIQACGTPVISKSEWGLLDTVVSGKTGLLGKNDRDLINNIVFLLENKDVAMQYGENGINFVESNFSPEVIVEQWFNLFQDVLNDTPPRISSIGQNPFHKYKYIRECMRRIKNNVPLMEYVPSIYEMRQFFVEIAKKYLINN